MSYKEYIMNIVNLVWSEIVSALENKELLSHFRKYGKSATISQTGRRIKKKGQLYPSFKTWAFNAT